MAKPKIPYFIKRVFDNYYRIFSDDVSVEELRVEGTKQVLQNPYNKSEFWVWIDPRYDPEEVIDEIEGLLDGNGAFVDAVNDLDI